MEPPDSSPIMGAPRFQQSLPNAGGCSADREGMNRVPMNLIVAAITVLLAVIAMSPWPAQAVVADFAPGAQPSLVSL